MIGHGLNLKPGNITNVLHQRSLSFTFCPRFAGRHLVPSAELGHCVQSRERKAITSPHIQSASPDISVSRQGLIASGQVKTHMHLPG
ncbi:hypothetical protein VTJ04DRAFT_36 [Mycothermus thermophilus]|uniref:uncharacterized protein n=1 Tax=Humicola insolens TaxID=85995 RepID=UPI0037432B1A